MLRPRTADKTSALPSLLGLCLLLANLQPVAARAATGTETRFDERNPSTWQLSAKLPPKSALREALIAELTAPAKEPGETALSRREAEALLDDPRAQLIYGEKTVSIVAPSMLARQRRGHLNLLEKFLEPERIDAGVQFARTWARHLARAEEKYKVDPNVVVSILMWESRLGTVTGDYFAFNSFTSQAFFIDEANKVALARPNEKKLLDARKQARRVETIRTRARRNLLALVRQCKTRGIDPLGVKGSWAGALGFPQFMPASLRWADDGDGDGKIDLYTFEDSIASIARYLSEHGFAKDREKAVWRYNHEDAYVKGVLAFADAMRSQLTAEASAPDAGAAIEPVSEKASP
jgi:membrane-bound lytic murein transglycosylase B